MTGEDPLLALIPARTLEANNRLRAQMIVDRVISIAVADTRDRARAEIFDVVLAHLAWSNREAIAKARAAARTPESIESISEKVSLAKAIGHRLATAIEKGEIDP